MFGYYAVSSLITMIARNMFVGRRSARLADPRGARDPIAEADRPLQRGAEVDADPDHFREIGYEPQDDAASVGSHSSLFSEDIDSMRARSTPASVVSRTTTTVLRYTLILTGKTVKVIDNTKYAYIGIKRYLTAGDFPRDEHNPIAFHPGLARVVQRTCITLWNVRRISRDIAAEHYTRRNPATDRRVVMDCLSTLEQQGTMPKGHSHPTAAWERNAVTAQFVTCAGLLGMQQYAVSWCPKDKGPGIRLNYLAKDATIPSRADVVPANAIITGVDVVDYLDVNELARYGRIMLFYSQVVEDVAGTAPDGLYSIEKGTYIDQSGRASVYNGTILHNRVNGGASYKHPMWDWGIDHFTVIDWWGNMITYLVEVRRCPSGRWIIACLPTSSVAYPLWWGRAHEPVKRRELIVGDAVVSEYHNGEKAILSVGLPGLWNCVKFEKTSYVGWLVKFQSAKAAMVGDVQRYMQVSKVPADDAIAWAPIVFALLQRGWRPQGVPMMQVAKVAMTTLPPIHFVSGDPYDQRFPIREIGNHEIARAFCPCLATVPNQAPADVAENECAAHRIRIKTSQDRLKKKTIKHQYKKYALEFVDCVLGGLGRGQGSPIDLEELYDVHWTRPCQQASKDRADTIGEVFAELKGFMKKELSKACKPRMIADVPTEQKAPFGCFTHSIMKALKDAFPWVGCGRTPEWTAQRVIDIAVGKDVPDDCKPAYPAAAEGDITNCDGSEMKWDRDHILDPIMFGFFSACFREELRGHLDFERPIPEKILRMKNGHLYKIMWELMSGSSRTTLANILKCAFREFCALRKKFPAKKAFALIGLHCGDDSVMHEFSFPMTDVRVGVAAELGMDMKLIVRSSAKQDPLTFLGEYYLNPWGEDKVRVPDFWRQVGKHNMTCNGAATLEQSAFNKAAGILSSCGIWDPVWGPWADKVNSLLRYKGYTVKNLSRDELWKIKTESVEYEEPVEQTRARVRDLWCTVFGVDGAVLDRFYSELALATSLDELPGGVFDNHDPDKEVMGSYRDDGWQGPVPKVTFDAETKQEGNTGTERPGQRRPPRQGGAAANAQPQREEENAHPADEQPARFNRREGSPTPSVGDAARQSILQVRRGREDNGRVQGDDGVLSGASERRADGEFGRERASPIPPEPVDVGARASGHDLGEQRDVDIRADDGERLDERWHTVTRSRSRRDRRRCRDEPQVDSEQVSPGGVGSRAEDDSRHLEPRQDHPDQVHGGRQGSDSSRRPQLQRPGRGGGEVEPDVSNADGANRDRLRPGNVSGKAPNDSGVHRAAGAAVNRKRDPSRGAQANSQHRDNDRGVTGGQRNTGSGKADQQRVPPLAGRGTVVRVSGRSDDRELSNGSRPVAGSGDRRPHVGNVHEGSGHDLPGHDGPRRFGGGSLWRDTEHSPPGLRGDLSHRGDSPDTGAANHAAPTGGRPSVDRGRGGPRSQGARTRPAHADGAALVPRNVERGGGRNGGTRGRGRGSGPVSNGGRGRGQRNEPRADGVGRGNRNRDVARGRHASDPDFDPADDAEAQALYEYYDRRFDDVE